jgi:hypothetical protein
MAEPQPETAPAARAEPPLEGGATREWKKKPPRWPESRVAAWTRNYAAAICALVRDGVQVLPGLDEQAQTHLTRRLSVAATRRFLLGALTVRASLAYMVTVAAASAAAAYVAVPGALHAQAGSIRACIGLIGFFLITGGLSVVLYRPIIRTTLTTWTHRHAGYRGLALGGAAVSAYYEADILVELSGEAHRLHMLEVYLTLGVVLAVVLVCGLLAAAAAGGESYHGVLEPLDLIFLQIFKIVLDLEKVRDQRTWVRPVVLPEIGSDLEHAARIAERSLRSRASLADPATRREASVPGAQIAAVVRAHKPALARTVFPRQIADIQQSLTAGLLAWSERDLAALIANAPPAAPTSLVRNAARRASPALILATAAATLPMIPALASRGSQIHATLGVLAVLSLVSNGVSATTSITNILAKINS